MSPVLSTLLAFLATWCRSNASVCLENLALRHQLAVYKQMVARPRLQPTDRLFWVWLARLWPGWRDALAFVQPRTVIAWQRQRFRDHWRRLSQRDQPGRPALAKEIRDLIRAMWQANPTWGAPRIVRELRKLGIEVAKSTVEKYRVRRRKPLWCAKIGAARISAYSSERQTLIGREVGQPIRPGHDCAKRGQSVRRTVVNSA